MFGAIALIFGWIKVVTYLRAYSGFSFIVIMLLAVFDEMKYFFFILIWILLGFSFSCKLFILKFLKLECFNSKIKNKIRICFR